MASPKELRAKLMERAHEVLEAYIDAATGKSNFGTLGDSEARREVWKLISKMIDKADDPILTNLADGDTTQKIQTILYQVSVGQVTPNEASRLMKLVVDGFQVTSIEDMVEKLREAGLLK